MSYPESENFKRVPDFTTSNALECAPVWMLATMEATDSQLGPLAGRIIKKIGRALERETNLLKKTSERYKPPDTESLRSDIFP